jgi:hypothetical protein
MSGLRDYLAGDNDGPGGQSLDDGRPPLRPEDRQPANDLSIEALCAIFDAPKPEWPADLTGGVDGEPSFGSENLP